MKIGICRLCLEEKELLSKSHIIPNFMYKPLFNDERHFISTNLKNIHKITKTYTGIFDSSIFCSKCDNNILSSLENYGNKTLFGGSYPLQIEFRKSPGEEGLKSIYIQGLDYTRFKLFLLSILWRASISRQEFFADIDLEVKYEEEIRKMILDNDGSTPKKFQTCLAYLDHSSDLVRKFISSPIKLYNHGNTAYAFLINGIVFHYNVSNHNISGLFDSGYIHSDGTMEMAILEGKNALSYFFSVSGLKKINIP